MNFSLPDSIAVLRQTPTVLCTLLDDLGPEWSQANEGGDSWSPVQVLAHLIGGERTDWITRARIIVAQGPDRRFPPFDRTGEIRASAGASPGELLDKFAALRTRNLAELEGWRLTPAQLQLTGTHPEFGTVTLQQLIATWVVHDLGHLNQISRVMASQYRAEVGPWRAYLPVLADRRGTGEAN